MKEENILNLNIQLPDKETKTLKEIIPDIIKGHTEKMIFTAQIIANYIARELPKKERLYPYQIRRVLGTIKRIEIEGFDSKKLLLLKPQLVFIASKNDSTLGIQYLRDILIESIDRVGEHEDYFRYFMDFFEAILAYYQAIEKD
ncbi:MAG TPA: type III-A CRISPR-associated protein Csm2 [Candidatus Eremiobacteraeota bacterium]|nr:MAG: hypothetical protein BWY64_02490 [bacterium ADurb.Bin363]HPZ07331.1 type III-A CRISPR-associated protein Csm2 [Candidatus Eremiobacteraeota bacterium]